MNFGSVNELLTRFGVGRRAVDDPFFEDAHNFCKVFQTHGVSVENVEDLDDGAGEEFQCSAPNCDEVFGNLAEFEIHYNSLHRYVCEECGIIRPNARLLEIHIQEVHDSFFKVCAEKRPMFQCYVPDCDNRFINSNERQRHCTELHKFPENFLYGAGDVDRTDLMDIQEDQSQRQYDNSIEKNIFGAKNMREFLEQLPD